MVLDQGIRAWAPKKCQNEVQLCINDLYGEGSFEMSGYSTWLSGFKSCRTWKAASKFYFRDSFLQYSGRRL